MKTVAIIPASGAGKRFQSHVAKQFLALNGLPILVHTLKTFEESNQVHEIILAVPSENVVSIRSELIKKYGMTKITSVVAGGRERQDSVKNCLDNLTKRYDWVIVHDAVRPFVTGALIKKVLDGAKETGAAACGVPLTDTLKETHLGEVVLKTVPRNNLWLTQTPQVFRLDILKSAYQKAYAEKFYGTDDASLVERLGKDVKMVMGFHENIKITTKEDMIMAETLMMREHPMSLRTGFGYDSHRLVSGRKFILGGVEIPFDKGLDGHSDADVLLHAVCDAILGAAALGDIGRHFPDNDSRYQNISSLILLEQINKMIKRKKFFIKNIDVTVLLESPKLAPYVDRIVSNICHVLSIPEHCVNIKAKTNEKMGFVGRKEGVAAFAVATLMEKRKR
jgi:2-C-methyl-D-erythritol 4-phosphate cytidylyltransferase/2-C-methyl-D-erythritol 2,4-cyclodiphosphate synthase